MKTIPKLLLLIIILSCFVKYQFVYAGNGDYTCYMESCGGTGQKACLIYNENLTSVAGRCLYGCTYIHEKSSSRKLRTCLRIGRLELHRLAYHEERCSENTHKETVKRICSCTKDLCNGPIDDEKFDNLTITHPQSSNSISLIISIRHLSTWTLLSIIFLTGQFIRTFII